MKYFIFSIDDGTIYDEKVINILNKYNFKGTFNLNSGLQDFVWCKGDKAVKRNDLNAVKPIYFGHEIASHSLTHPFMSQCPDEIVYHEAHDDIQNLENIFNTKIETFGFPFQDYDERCINLISKIGDIKVIRISVLDKSFKFPTDIHHVKITSWDINETLDLFDNFKNDATAQLFVFVAHAYDFEFANSYDKLDTLCKKISKEDDIEVIPMKSLVGLF